MTRGGRGTLSSVLLLAAIFVGDTSDLQASPNTLATVRSRGHVVCGVDDGAAGYSALSAQGVWSGIGIDFCRALAAGVVGSKQAVKFRHVAAHERIAALRAGEIDVLARHTAPAPGQDAAYGVRIVGVLVHDGQGFMVRRSQNITSALELSGARICVTRDSGAGYRISVYFTGLNMPFELVKFDRWQGAVMAYAENACQVLSADLPELARARLDLGDAGEHVILPELAAKRPIGPAVREDDDEWFSVVRWTLYALIAAEQLGVASAGVDWAKSSANPEVRRFLGIDMDLGKRLGLSADWTQRIVRQLGNYGELFERHLGQKSPLKLERRLNNLSSNGGLHYAPSFR